jgi:hypothetical protein
MNLGTHVRRFVCLLVAILAQNPAVPAWAMAPTRLELRPQRVPWERLMFQAKSVWVDVTVEVVLEPLPWADVEASLLESPRGEPVRPSSADSHKIAVETTIDPAFRRRFTEASRVWFDPKDATALGRVRWQRGDGDFRKTYRFTHEGVFRHRIEPKNEEEELLEPERWTDIKDSFFPYNLTELKCSNVSERTVLIYVVSAARNLLKGETLSLCVFGKRQLHRVSLRSRGTEPIKVDYVEKRQDLEVRRNGKIDAVAIALDSEPVESDLSEAENFSFFGFHENIVLFVDPASRLPIRASGTIPSFGKATLSLDQVHLR